ncbi:MAG: EAL domain-containing protein [Acidobacteriota bacterium]|nr:EAL domain-containing protein [Acidobacteriota bacterium]
MPTGLTVLLDRKRLTAAAISAAMLLAAVGVVIVSRWQGRKEVLRVGFNQFPPYLLVDNAKEKPDGLAALMVEKAAKLAGVRMRWVYVNGTADEALRHRKIDLFPLLTLTDERKAEFYASQPWWENEIALISRQDHPLRNPKDTAGERIAIRGMPVLKRVAETLFPQARLVIVPEMERMLAALCARQVDGFFLDFRLVESQLLKGTSSACAGGLHVASLPHASLSLSTIANPEKAWAADRIFEQLAELAADGTLSEYASRWSLYNSFQSRHVKESLQAKHRAELMRYGLGAMVLILILISSQTQRIRRAHLGAEAARREAEESRQRFDAFMENTPTLTFIKDASGRMAFVNPAFCEQFQISSAEALGKTDHELWPKEMADEFRRLDLEVLATNQCRTEIEKAPSPNGELRSYMSFKFPFLNRSGETLIGGVAVDITERLRTESQLKLSQFSVDCSQDTMLWIDSGGLIFNANHSACQSLGYLREELVGLHVSCIDPMVDHGGFLESREKLKQARSLTVESVHRRKDGHEFPVEIRQNYLEFDGHQYSCCMSRDITERKKWERELSFQALHDLLTGLPNRRYLETCLGQAVDHAHRDGTALAVLYLDLDGFKLVNDTLGHGVGDQLLKAVSVRLQTCLRECDTLFRMGGDEFTLVLTHLPDGESARIVAQKLLAGFQEGFTIEGHDLLITASIGVSIFPLDGLDGGELLQNADAALYESKRQGKNRIQFFTPEMGQAARERLDLESHLRRALEREELSLHYQPEVCMKTGNIVRHEALLRWRHPVLGDVPPSKFIPIAEETTLIVPIGTWVLEESCREASAWQHTGSKGVGVGVNVSLVQFGRADFVETVTLALQRSGLPAHLLELELTESVVMQGVENVTEKINRLRRLGLSIAIDDFGTGYSSLSYLQQLPIDCMKIDRSFVRNIASDPEAVLLTKSLIAIAHSLRMKVVVEGIETPGQLDVLRKLGCEIGQGYWLGRPSAVPALSRECVAA